MKIVFAIAVLILTSSLASAALLTVNCSVVSSPTELNANIVCPQFSGGGLTSVQISVSGGITGSITLTNNASTSQTVTGTTSSAFSIGALAGFTIVNPIFSASYTTGPQSLTAGQSKTFAGLSGTGRQPGYRYYGSCTLHGRRHLQYRCIDLDRANGLGRWWPSSFRSVDECKWNCSGYIQLCNDWGP